MPDLLAVIPCALGNCLRCAFLAWHRGAPVKLYAIAGLLRTWLSAFSPRQIQFMAPPSIDTYNAWMEKKKAETTKQADSVVLDRLRPLVEWLLDGQSSLLWVGNREKASRYVLFFPGGGYLCPLTPGHLEWCFRAYVDAENGQEVAVALLQYTLCPAARFPIQLEQAKAALSHLIKSGIPASKIVIGGDSAGGNLTAQLLIHLAHQTGPNALSEPLAGAFVVSPWLSGATTNRSFTENNHIDMLSTGHINTSFEELLGPDMGRGDSRSDCGEWAMPLDADRKWLDNWSQITKALYVTVGANEVLRDQGILFAEIVRQRNDKVNVHLDVFEKDAHDFVLLEGLGAYIAGGRMKDDQSCQLARHRSQISSYFD